MDSLRICTHLRFASLYLSNYKMSTNLRNKIECIYFYVFLSNFLSSMVNTTYGCSFLGMCFSIHLCDEIEISEQIVSTYLCKA